MLTLNGLSAEVLAPSEHHPGDFAVVFDDAFSIKEQPTMSAANDIFLDASSRILSLAGEITSFAFEEDVDSKTYDSLENEVAQRLGMGYKAGKSLVQRLSNG